MRFGIWYLKFRVRGYGFRVLGLGLRVKGKRFMVKGSRFRILELGKRNSGIMIQDTRFKVWG